MFKKILSIALAVAISTSGVLVPTAYAAGSNTVNATPTVTSVAAYTTLATAPNTVKAVVLRNDGNVTVYADFDQVAVAASSTAIPIAPCESLTINFPSGLPRRVSLITASGSASVRVIGLYRGAIDGNVQVATKDSVKFDNLPACAASTSALSTVNGASFLPYVESELFALNTGALTTDSTNNLLRADSLVEGVTCRQTVAITTSTNWGISDPTTANRFASATAIATTTLQGLLQNFGSSAAAGPVQAAAAKLRITVTGANPGAGTVRCSVFGRQLIAPQS